MDASRYKVDGENDNCGATLAAVNLNVLPDEILEFIFTYLPPYGDLEHCSLVCKRWHAIVKSGYLESANIIQLNYLLRLCRPCAPFQTQSGEGPHRLSTALGGVFPADSQWRGRSTIILYCRKICSFGCAARQLHVRIRRWILVGHHLQRSVAL